MAGVRKKNGRKHEFTHCSDGSFLSQQRLLLPQDPEHGQDIPGSKIFVQTLDVDREQVAYLRVHGLCQCQCRWTRLCAEHEAFACKTCTLQTMFWMVWFV